MSDRVGEWALMGHLWSTGGRKINHFLIVPNCIQSSYKPVPQAGEACWGQTQGGVIWINVELHFVNQKEEVRLFVQRFDSAKVWLCKVREWGHWTLKQKRGQGFASLWLSLVAQSALFVHSSLKASRKCQWNKINFHSYPQARTWLDNCPTGPLSYFRKEKQVVSDAG